MDLDVIHFINMSCSIWDQSNKIPNSPKVRQQYHNGIFTFLRFDLNSDRVWLEGDWK